MNFQFRQQPTTLSVQALNVELARVSPDGDVTINWEEVGKAAEAKASNMQTAMAKMLIAARDAGKQAAPAVPQGEPFGWTDCAATDEGAIALYERPAAPAAPAAPDVMSILRAIHRRPSDAGIWLDDITRILRDAPAPAVPQDMRMVPASLLEELESSLYEFGQGRCFTSIDLDRYKRLGEVLAATPAAPSQPVTLTDGLIEKGAMTGMVDAQIDSIIAALREKEGT